jgi:hypothetical protein
MINTQAKGNVEIELSNNGGYIIKSTTQEIIPVNNIQVKPIINNSRSKQQLFTASGLEEALQIAREQLQSFI